jgi:hypothetical protein
MQKGILVKSKNSGAKLQNHQGDSGLTGITELTRGLNRYDPMDQDPTALNASTRTAAAASRRLAAQGGELAGENANPSWGCSD